MQLFNNASITAKSLISVLIGVLALLGMAGLAISSLIGAQQSDAMQGAAVDVMSRARDSWIDLARGQAALYRAINLKSMNVEVALIREAKNDSVQAIKRARQILETLDVSGVSIDTQLVTGAVKSLAAYADSAGQAAAFVEEDAFNATMFMNDAEQKYGAAQRDVSTLVATAIELENVLDREMTATMHSRLIMIMISAAVAVSLLLALSVWLSRLISLPIKAMTQAMRRLATGDLAVDIPAGDRRDEVGQMARALAVFRSNAQEARTLQTAADQEHALKERRQAAMDRHTQDFGASAAGVMASLARSAETMRDTAGEMSSAAQRTRDSAAATAHGAEVSSLNLGTVAAAAEEMSVSISEISQQVARATHAARDAVQRASVTDTKVAGMATAADRVGDVVRLITDIASQTNLLALNATIEAARAGEAGKGFAVVAGEVKALASQTARATDEIATQITAIRNATGEAVTAVREVSAAIGEVDEVASAIAAAVEEQAATTRNITASVQTVAAATQDATKAMQEVSAVSETTDAASRKVLTGADEVSRNAESLRVELTQFLAAMASTEGEDRLSHGSVAGNGAVAVLPPNGADREHRSRRSRAAA